MNGKRNRFLHLLSRYPLQALSMLFLVLMVFLAIFAPYMTIHDPYEQNIFVRLRPPSSGHWMGMDQLGRDIFARITYGARYSLMIGILASGIGCVLGTTLGLTCGFFGGRVDSVIMRVVDLMLSFPGVLLAILLVSVLGPGLDNLIIALAVWFTPTMARVIRSNVMVIMKQEYIESARAQGAGAIRIMLRHLLPNCMSPIIVYGTLSVANALLVAASLSFLGLGIQPPTPEWGAMIGAGRRYLRDGFHVTLFPGVAIFLTVLALNLIGDALRDLLDPRLKGQG